MDGAFKSRLVVQGWSQVPGIDYGRPTLLYIMSQLGQQSRQRQVYVIIHRDAGQHPDQLQGGTAGANCTVYSRSRARGVSSDNEGGDVLLQHDVGAGLR